MTAILIAILVFLPLHMSKKQNHPSQKEIHPIFSVLSVKNCEDSIEGIIRSIAWKTSTNNEKSYHLVVLDTGSDDKTLDILKKLSQEYDFVHPMRKSEYINFIAEL